MADWFVKTDGSDVAAGNSWSAAFQTVKKAVTNNTSLAAGDRIYVAPGVYGSENAITPYVAGTAGNICQLIGDYNETKADGGSATHGKGVGYVIVTSGNTTTKVSGSATIFNASNNWDRWSIEGLYLNSGTGSAASFSPGSSGQTLNSFVMKDCILEADDVALSFQSWTPTDADDVALFSRCKFINHDNYAQSVIQVVTVKSTAHFTNWPIRFTNCEFYCCAVQSANKMMFFNAAGATTYTKARFTECLIYDHSLSDAHALFSGNATYCSIELARCILRGSGIGVPTFTYTDINACIGFGAVSGGVKIGDWEQIPPFAYLHSHSGAINQNSSRTSPTESVDVHGQTRPVGNGDCGSQEWQEAGQAPEQPVGNVYGAGGGGDFPDASNVTTDDTTNGVAGTLTVPAVGDVRSGTQYGGGGTEYTGTMSSGKPGMKGSDL